LTDTGPKSRRKTDKWAVPKGPTVVEVKQSFCYIWEIGEGTVGVPAFERIIESVYPSMRFSQLDRIISLEKGKTITAVKCLSLSEEYLQDHFPRFPVMPGVLMLESLFQTSMWLVRASHDFKYSSVVLRETRSLKFQGFVQPGDSLLVVAEIKSVHGSLTNLKVSGTVDGKPATSGRLVVDTFNLAERDGLDSAIDDYRNHQFRSKFRRLCNQLDPENPSYLVEEPSLAAE
jgi:3-hydroxyacyl-[acyl-carrier-protein] dehydratase